QQYNLGVEESATPAVLKKYKLNQNYPNPFNSKTLIQFYLPEEVHVTLKIYNLLGKEIKTLANGSLHVGVHQIVWDGTDQKGRSMGSGLYFYWLNTASFQQVKKMILIR
ncbi:MAG: FlgD immunoglobulin-like domain containing protein, partial [Fidelibacterota bacterium]